tara:strand:+ start:2655 stop:3209 length:555 start_codon:yes stop_codon:yes gene_type:complete
METISDYENLDINNIDEKLEENVNLIKNTEEEVEKKESNVDILFDKLQSQFNDSQQILKTLHNNLKILYKEVLKERKELTKKNNKMNKKKKKKNNLSGFAVPTKITKELADFLNLEHDIEISRTDVTSLICKYIKENNLQNPDNKKIILPDQKLKTLFNGYLSETDQLEFFNIQSYLKYHFIKS